MSSAPASRRASARRQPPGDDQYQFIVLSAGLWPMNIMQSAWSTSSWSDTSGEPNSFSATTWALFWSTDPTQ